MVTVINYNFHISGLQENWLLVVGSLENGTYFTTEMG